MKKIRFAPWRIRSVVKKYHREIAKEVEENIKPFKGISYLLKSLSKNYSLGIVSGNSKKNIKVFLKRNKLDSYFKIIFSDKSLFWKHKILRRILKSHNLDKEEIIYVGDELRDIEACEKLDIKIIAVGWGFQSGAFLKKHNPAFLAKTPKDILKIVGEL